MQYAPSECPEIGTWVYLQAQMQCVLLFPSPAWYLSERHHAFFRKANSGDTNVFNVTFANLYGFELYLNNQVNCPSESSCVSPRPLVAQVLTDAGSYVGDVYTGARYTRLDVSFESGGVVYGSRDLDIRVGLKRVNSTQCTFSATMWDPAQSTASSRLPFCRCSCRLLLDM